MKMKTPIMIIILALFFGSCAVMKNGSQKKTVEIKTSAQCGMCKERIEGELNYVKGIQFAELNVDNQILTVKYNEEIISLQQIKDKVNEIGYDADGQKAPADKVKELPMCCQPGGHK